MTLLLPAEYWCNREMEEPAMVNKVMLVGRLGKDPEMRYSPQGDPVITLSVATTHS
jgi:Single-strand binding protein family